MDACSLILLYKHYPQNDAFASYDEFGADKKCSGHMKLFSGTLSIELYFN